MDNMDIKFGRKNGSYDFSKSDKGISRSAFGNNAAADSIFKKFDRDNNNILDAQELADAKAAIKEAAEKHKKTNMGKREAANFLGEDYKGTDAQKDILEFLNIIGSSADSVESANTDENGNTTVKYNHDDSKNTQVTENYVKNGEKSVLDSKVYNNDDGSKLTETYEKDGTTLKSKTLVQGSVTTEFDPKNPDKPIRKITDKGGDTKEIVEYTYNEDGTITETTSLNDKVVSHVIKDAKGNAIKTTEYTYDGDKKTTTQKEGNKEIIIVEENGKQVSATQNIYNDNGHKLSQTKEIGDNSYSVEYDGEGNTPVVVQNKETIDDIAQKFGCEKEDLINANKDLVKGDEKNPKFEPGQEIKIPREVEADDEALQNRKTSQEVIAEHARDEQIRIQQEAKAEAARLQREAKARAREAQCKELGLIDHKGAGETVEARFGKNNKPIGDPVKLKKIGNANNGRVICEDKNGKIYVVSHDHLILRASYVKGTEAYNKGEKVEAHAKDKNGNPITVKCAYVQKKYDKHGRSVVVDQHGQYHIMSHDKKLLSSEYVQKSNRADAIKSDAKVARSETISMLSAQLDSAQRAFDQQMKEDGWAGDVADGISALWGSDNRASKVRADLNAYRNTINELKNCKSDEEFKTKFKQKFGVEYNADAIANYLMKPSAENYRKAFGTKQPIGERVAKYNESQQTGAAIVKTGATVTGGIALTAATVLTAGAAGVAFGVTAGAATAAGSTFVADVVVETTDRASSEEGFKEGGVTEMVKDATIDGVVAGATFGVGKALGAGYKVYKGTRAAAKAASAAEQAAARSAAQAAENVATSAERGVVIAERTATSAEHGVVAAEKAAAKAEGSAAKEAAKVAARKTAGEAEETAASSAEKAVQKAKPQGETSVARAETDAAETAVTKAETETAETGAAEAGEAASESSAAAATSAELTGMEEAVADAVADTAVGAGAEYVQNGEITLEGTLTNMAMGSVGLAGEKIGSKLKGKLHKKGSPDADPAGGPNKPNGPDAPKDGPDAPKGDAEVPKDGAEAHKDNTEAPKDGTETPNNGTETPNAGADASQGGTETPNGGDKKTNDVNSMSEQEIKNEIDKLQPEYNIAKVEFETSEKLRSDFSDFIEGNLSDPAEIKRQYRKLSVLAHPDKSATLGNGVNQGLYQAINNMKAAYDSHDLKKINAAIIEFKKVMAIVDVNFSVADVRMKNLHDGLNSAKASGNASGKSVHEQSNNSYQDQVHEQASSKFKKTADIRLQANEPMQVSSYDSIRLGDKVDIDLRDLDDKLKAMKDGDSFYIGRTVNGPNNIRINHESVSGTHLKVEKRNGQIYITDMGSTNGTKLNTTQPDYAAKYSPEVQAKYDKARVGQDYYNIMEENYSNLRHADYSYENSVRSNITDADLHDTTRVNIQKENGYCYRTQKGKPTVTGAVDRISLNVVADKNLLKELDELCSKGTYINSRGERVQIRQQNCTYKTPQSLSSWSTRHDPITMYFDEKASPQFQNAVAEITAKYQRPSSNGKALMGSLDGKPWIAHEAYVKPSDAEALYKEAKRLNPDLADAIFYYLHGDNDWNCSTGRFAAAQKTLDEYKLASAGKARNVNINSGSITPEHRMAMEQISNNINHARTYKDLENAQRLLNTIPDCRQKEILQRQLNQRFEQAKFKSA